MTDKLLTSTEVPQGFSYPEIIERLVENEMTYIEPWAVLTGDLLRERHVGIAKRYASRRLIVFAAREDRDDVACWDMDNECVSVIHDFADSGQEQIGRFEGVEFWLRSAVEDFIGFT